MIEETIKTPEEKDVTQEQPVQSRAVCLDAVMQLYSRGEINTLYDKKEELKK